MQLGVEAKISESLSHELDVIQSELVEPTVALLQDVELQAASDREAMSEQIAVLQAQLADQTAQSALLHDAELQAAADKEALSEQIAALQTQLADQTAQSIHFEQRSDVQAQKIDELSSKAAAKDEEILVLFPELKHLKSDLIVSNTEMQQDEEPEMQVQQHCALFLVRWLLLYLISWIYRHHGLLTVTSTAIMIDYVAGDKLSYARDW